MPKFSNKHVVDGGRATFYAAIWPELRQAAITCGWALGLHGSLVSDMDIMAMPWTEEATPVEQMIKAIGDIFTDNPFKEGYTKPFYGKPHGRVVYTLCIFADMYLDISIMPASIPPLSGAGGC